MFIAYIFHVSQSFGVQQYQCVTRLFGVKNTPYPDAPCIDSTRVTYRKTTCGRTRIL